MIEVEQLSKFYGSYQAIADLSFKVETGEILGFLGPNGAGKTTTMRILTGYLPASKGSAKIAGFDVHQDSMAVRQRIGYLPETPPLYPDMTVEGYLDFVAQLKGVSPGDRPTRVRAAIRRCGLEDRHNTIIGKLSKGYRQRVGIAQAIVHDPPVIILDEPTVGLDPRQIIEVRELIKSLAGQHTVILSTHILPEVSVTCDRITIINKGRVVATNSPESLMADLTTGGGYQLEVEGDPQKSLALLQGIPGVREAQVLAGATAGDPSSLAASLQAAAPQAELGRHIITVTTEGSRDIGRDLAGAIVSAGFGLYELRRTRASLEDVFLKLTTQDAPPEQLSGASNYPALGASEAADPEASLNPAPELLALAPGADPEAQEQSQLEGSDRLSLPAGEPEGQT